LSNEDKTNDYENFASFLSQTTSFETEVQEREPWDFYEWITCNEKPRCAPNIFPHNVLAGNINTTVPYVDKVKSVKNTGVSGVRYGAKYENGVAYLLSYTVSVEKMWTQNTCIIHDVGFER
jgi:hypothetical protein